MELKTILERRCLILILSLDTVGLIKILIEEVIYRLRKEESYRNNLSAISSVILLLTARPRELANEPRRGPGLLRSASCSLKMILVDGPKRLNGLFLLARERLAHRRTRSDAITVAFQRAGDPNVEGYFLHLFPD